MVLVLRFPHPILGTQGTGIVDLSIDYLKHFVASKIDSCDHAHLHLQVTITNIVCTYLDIQPMWLSKREHLITTIFPPYLS